MLFAPRQEGNVQVTQGKKEKWGADHERQQVGGINSREARLPKPPRSHRRISVGVHENEPRQHEEEIHADIADAGEVLIPPGTTGEYADDAHVEQNDVQSGEETQRGERL